MMNATEGVLKQQALDSTFNQKKCEKKEKIKGKRKRKQHAQHVWLSMLA